MRKLIISAFAPTAAVLLASFMPRGTTPGAPSIDPHEMTIASPALAVNPQPDAF
jgi:hypothetical protein